MFEGLDFFFSYYIALFSLSLSPFTLVSLTHHWLLGSAPFGIIANLFPSDKVIEVYDADTKQVLASNLAPMSADRATPSSASSNIQLLAVGIENAGCV